jgi:nucleoside phosphorylase
MSKIGISLAMSQEAERLLTLFGLNEYDEVFSKGFFYDSPAVTVAVCGAGTIAPVMAVMTLRYKYCCDEIYNVGSCGSTGPKNMVGDIVSVGSVYKGDVDLTLVGFKKNQMPNAPAAISLPVDNAYPAATCRSSDKFIGAGSDVEKDIIVEMEAYSIAYVCYRMGIPCHIYKVVSDMTDKNDDGSQFEGNVGKVSERLAEHIYRIISQQSI